MYQHLSYLLQFLEEAHLRDTTQRLPFAKYSARYEGKGQGQGNAVTYHEFLLLLKEHLHNLLQSLAAR